MNLVHNFRQIIKLLIKLPVKLIALFVFGYERFIQLIFPTMTGAIREDFINSIDNDIKEVIHETLDQEVRFKLYTPNRMCSTRYRTFSTKEPEMLEWVDEYGGDGTFYDIGANIGIYSIYYAKVNPGKVYSFEPSVFNLRQLAKNISINSLDERITIISNPLTRKTGIEKFKNVDSDEGGALSAFGVDYGHDGKILENNIRYSVLGFSLDDLINSGLIQDPPTLIKIDVDGIEDLILSGAKETLMSDICKSVYIEVNDDFEKQALGVKELLEVTGFTLKEKRIVEFEKSNKIAKTFNQIWAK